MSGPGFLESGEDVGLGNKACSSVPVNLVGFILRLHRRIRKKRCCCGGLASWRHGQEFNSWSGAAGRWSWDWGTASNPRLLEGRQGRSCSTPRCYLALGLSPLIFVYHLLSLPSLQATFSLHPHALCPSPLFSSLPHSRSTSALSAHGLLLYVPVYSEFPIK